MVGKQINQQLDDEQKQILFGQNTEAPFSGKFVDHKANGSYACINCGSTLFDSRTKFDSGSGWPSFYDVATDTSVTLHEDDSHGMQRTEVRCRKCGSHLGHLFNDGPADKTGQRYCINSACLDFKDGGKQ